MKHHFFILVAAIMLIACHSQAQKKGFCIKGTLTGNYPSTFQTDSMFLCGTNEQILASAPLVNGKFELKGYVSEPQEVAVCTRENGVGRIILENADYTYTCNNNSVIIKGGTLHDMVMGSKNSKEYNDAVDAYEKTMDSLLTGKTYEELTPEENKLINRKADIAIAVESRSFNKVLDDPQSPVLAKAFAVLKTQQWEKYPPQKRITLFKSYEKELGGSKLIAEMRTRFEEMLESENMQKTVATGNMFKDVNAVDVNGNVVKLSDVIAKNKYTILEFWASWCGPCRGEIPNLKKAYAKYKDKGLEIYAVSLDDKKAKWLQALKEENTPWLNLNDPAAFKGEASKGYGLSGVPASFLIGQDGKIVVSDEGLRGEELEETLNRYMP